MMNTEHSTIHRLVAYHRRLPCKPVDSLTTSPLFRCFILNAFLAVATVTICTSCNDDGIDATTDTPNIELDNPVEDIRGTESDDQQETDKYRLSHHVFAMLQSGEYGDRRTWSRNDVEVDLSLADSNAFPMRYSGRRYTVFFWSRENSPIDAAVAVIGESDTLLEITDDEYHALKDPGWPEEQ